MEIEMSLVHTTHYPTWPFQYKFVRDGSLPERGKELILGPISGVDVEKCLTRVIGDLTTNESQVNSACGFHVHVDGRDMNGFDIRRLLTLYNVCEEGFYSLVDPTRKHNHYSIRYPDGWLVSLLKKVSIGTATSSTIREELVQMLYPNTRPDSQRQLTQPPLLNRSAVTAVTSVERGMSKVKRYKENKYEQARYYGLNLHSLLHRGSVEFRHHHGTLSLKRMISWVELCGWFIHLSVNLSDREAEEVTSLPALLSGRWKRPGWVLGVPVATQKAIHELRNSRNASYSPDAVDEYEEDRYDNEDENNDEN